MILAHPLIGAFETQILGDPFKTIEDGVADPPLTIDLLKHLVGSGTGLAVELRR